jgi:hypothetical protein
MLRSLPGITRCRRRSRNLLAAASVRFVRGGGSGGLPAGFRGWGVHRGDGLGATVVVVVTNDLVGMCLMTRMSGKGGVGVLLAFN